ncbi:MAG: 23S rRNA (guanosine(2251)-2'-O)-methyltransferase RlmB [Acidimicrobiia bacterium]|nr:23S rRNA (guanosine(2251)-2'-O)-methyltransferase RlmB [Acidimicrobiia bacterium]MBT8215036.1 23S rRNA (guanosine(2251)-2'-O)-methyltransferase RlmB [Acidimicrobiia bacterium]NNF69693.1 23S rRNA (guanosine(2251)-2'-O)-methyltransferase RlmB [Acidimicrobiia bacterium]
MAPAGIGADVEGVHAVSAALAAGRVTGLTVERSRVDDLVEIVDRAREAGVPVTVVADVRDLARTTAPQGVVASARPIAPMALSALIETAPDPKALIVFDHLTDPRNVGAIARTAWAAGIGGLVVSGRRSAPLGATAFKAAAGALEHLPIAEVGSVADAVEDLRRREIWTIGLSGDAETGLYETKLLTEPVALVIGAEGRGLSRLAAERCDQLVSIPMAPGTESLNASVAAALAMYELARARGWVT